MIFSTILRYTKHKIKCYLDHARVAWFSALAFFNSAAYPQLIDTQSGLPLDHWHEEELSSRSFAHRAAYLHTVHRNLERLTASDIKHGEPYSM